MLSLFQNFLTPRPLLLPELRSRQTLIYAAWLVLILVILVFNLQPGGLLPGYSLSEIEALSLSNTLPLPWQNPLYWPYYFSVYCLRWLISDGILAARIVSYLLSLLAGGGLLIILRRWFGLGSSLIGATLFLCNSWVLQMARSGTPEISLITAVLVLAIVVLMAKNWVADSRFKALALIVLAACWFMPLLPWLVAGLLIWAIYKRDYLIRYWGSRFQLGLSLFLAGLLIIGLFGLSHNQAQFYVLLGINPEPGSLSQLWHNLTSTLQAIFWQAPYAPERWLARLPFLDIFSFAMLPLGFYAVYKKLAKSWRPYISGTLLLLLSFATFNQGLLTPGLQLLLLLLSIVVIAGIHEFAKQWRQVFPLNPLARVVGLGAITLLISLSWLYQMNRYFIAWVNHPETQEIYSLSHEDVKKLVK